MASLILEIWESHGREGKKIVGVRMEDTSRTWPTESIKKGSHGLTEIKAASTGHAWVWTTSFAYMLRLLAWCRGNTPNSASQRVCL